MTDIVRKTFAQMTKVPRSLLTTDREHRVPCSEVPGGVIVFKRRGLGKAAQIVGTVGETYETVVYGRLK
jgi:hypothetical protein